MEEWICQKGFCWQGRRCSGSEYNRRMSTSQPTINSGPLKGLLRVALLLSAVMFLPDTLLRLPRFSLDGSWAIGVGLAIQNHFVFGRDIVFHYGPLSYLLLRLPFGSSVPMIVLFDGLIFGHCMAVIVYLARALRSAVGLALALLTILVLGAMRPYAEVVQILVLFLLFFDLAHFLTTGKTWTLAAAGVLCAIMWLVKLNPGIPMAIIFLVFLGYLLLRPHGLRRRMILAGLGGYILSLVVLAWWLKIDLPGYLIGALHIIGPYNDAMALPVGPLTLPTLYAALLVMGAFIAISLWNLRAMWRNFNLAVVFALAGLILFISFKYSFVRADTHSRGFFYASAPILRLLTLFLTVKQQRQSLVVFLLALLFSLPHLAELTPSFFQMRLSQSTQYAAMLINPSLRPEARSIPKSGADAPLPVRFIERIGQSGVDVAPIDIYLVYLYGLNYNPRPMFQTLTTYDSYLDKINFEKYAGSSAPQFLIFSVGDIDDRHPFFTETKTKLAILAHYQIVDRTERYLLLERRPKALPCQVHQIAEETIPFDRMLSIPKKSGMVILRPSIRYSLPGTLARIFYQPPMLKVVVRRAGEQNQRWRAITPIVNNGVIISPYVEDLPEAESWITTYGVGMLPVSGVRFETPAPWGFAAHFDYRLYTVVFGAEDGDGQSLAACVEALR